MACILTAMIDAMDTTADIQTDSSRQTKPSCVASLFKEYKSFARTSHEIETTLCKWTTILSLRKQQMESYIKIVEHITYLSLIALPLVQINLFSTVLFTERRILGSLCKNIDDSKVFIITHVAVTTGEAAQILCITLRCQQGRMSYWAEGTHAGLFGWRIATLWVTINLSLLFLLAYEVPWLQQRRVAKGESF